MGQRCNLVVVGPSTYERPDRDFGSIVTDTVASLPGRSVEVNPFALRDDPVPLSVEERKRRLDALRC